MTSDSANLYHEKHERCHVENAPYPQCPMLAEKMLAAKTLAGEDTRGEDARGEDARDDGV